ncbi:kinase-like domain-containing protein [Cubamyces lactineus]|nr:kinase-like domain-containing protein [Cubamyces lactineus]
MAHGDMSFFSRPSSSAVKISAPPSDEPSSPKPSKKDSTQRQCRNILIYGHCKFQDKGCIYYHPPRDAPSPAPPDSPTPGPALPAQAVNAPVFVPKINPGSPTPAAAVPASIQQQSSISSDSSSEQSASQPQADFQSEQTQTSDGEQYDPYNPYSYPSHGGEASDEGGQVLSMNPYDMPPGYDTATLDPFYAPQMTYHSQPLNYHLYSLPRPDTLAHRYFVSDDIREELQKRSEIIHTVPPAGLGLPEELQGYHTLVPLETIGADRRKFGSWYSTVYRATNSSDGVTYVLRRAENFRLTQPVALTRIEAWSRLRHPNLVSVHEAFTTRAFNDSSLVVVYDDHPNAQTLYDAHIKAKPPQFQGGRLQAQSNRIAERTLWSYIIQIANAIKAVHDAGLAVRLIDATKILVTGKNRVRLGSCGIVDVLMHDMPAEISFLQQDDLTMLGGLIIQLCSGTMSAMNHLQKAVEALGRNYSSDLKSVVLFLISKPGTHKTVGQLFDMIGSRLLTELDESQNAVDRLESELMSELENGRLVRLLCKFGFINERPEHNHETRWSETGDRYIVKLFRDYVFHQVDEVGRPVVNLTHVLTCLNKLDAGTDERIMLVSRDEQSCLVVSYREVKACIESAFSELTRS